MAKLTIVHLIPTYNESENVTLLLPSLSKLYRQHAKYRFLTLFVDDSSDNTSEIIISYRKNHKDIIIIKGHRKGLGSAMIQGYRYALAKLKPDIIISNEADFAYEHALIPKMIEKINNGFDVVIASRHVPGGTTKGWTFSRHANHWIANTLFASWIAGGDYVTDHNGAFRAIRVKGVLNQISWKSFPLGFAFFNYLLFRLRIITTKFYEFPVTYHFRTEGESKISFNPKYIKSYFRNIREYISVCIKIRMSRP